MFLSLTFKKAHLNIGYNYAFYQIYQKMWSDEKITFNLRMATRREGRCFFWWQDSVVIRRTREDKKIVDGVTINPRTTTRLFIFRKES